MKNRLNFKTMREKKSKAHRRRGFTLPEILIATVIIGLSLAALSTGLGSLFKSTKNAQSNAHVIAEQEALSSLIQSMDQKTAVMALCPAPHPFYSVNNDGTVGCESNYDESKLPIEGSLAQSVISASEELLKLAFQWHNEGDLRHDPTAPLSQSFYTEKIHPKLEQAKCLKCHGGDEGSKEDRRENQNSDPFLRAFPQMNLDRLAGRPTLYAIDFGSFAGMTQPVSVGGGGNQMQRLNPAIASRSILSSKLGQYLLRPVFEFNEALHGSKNKEIRTTIKISRDQITVNKTLLFPYSLVLANQASGTCDRAKLACNQPSDILIEASCKASCTNEETNWCSCGKGCNQPCPGNPYRCTQYKWTYSCNSTAALFPGTRAGFGEVLGMDHEMLKAAVSDQECVDAQNERGERWCKKPELVCGENEPSDDVDICMIPGSCKKTCLAPLKDLGQSCGKNCWTPPQIIGCKEVEYEYSCTGKTTKPLNIMKFEMDTRYIDPDSKGLRSVKGSGVIQ